MSEPTQKPLSQEVEDSITGKTAMLQNGYIINGIKALESKLALYGRCGCDLVVCNEPQSCGTVKELEEQVKALKEQNLKLGQLAHNQCSECCRTNPILQLRTQRRKTAQAEAEVKTLRAQWDSLLPASYDPCCADCNHSRGCGILKRLKALESRLGEAQKVHEKIGSLLKYHELNRKWPDNRKLDYDTLLYAWVDYDILGCVGGGAGVKEDKKK